MRKIVRTTDLVLIPFWITSIISQIEIYMVVIRRMKISIYRTLK
jgi:hypothetical protein